MKKLTKEEKHAQCTKEIKCTLLVAVVCCLWECITAFALNGNGKYFLGFPAWVSVSIFGECVIAVLGVWWLMKKVFVDFEYDDEVEEGGNK